MIEIFSSEILPYATLFLLFFAVVFFILKRSVFRENKNISLIIAGCISLISIWSLTNYTNYMYDFSNLLDNLEGSSGLIFFMIGGLVVAFLIFSGMKKSKVEFPLSLFGLAGIFILVKFLPVVFPIYSLPDFLTYDIVGWISLIIGIFIFIFALSKIKKKKNFRFF